MIFGESTWRAVRESGTWRPTHLEIKKTSTSVIGSAWEEFLIFLTSTQFPVTIVLDVKFYYAPTSPRDEQIWRNKKMIVVQIFFYEWWCVKGCRKKGWKLLKNQFENHSRVSLVSQHWRLRGAEEMSPSQRALLLSSCLSATPIFGYRVTTALLCCQRPPAKTTCPGVAAPPLQRIPWYCSRAASKLHPHPTLIYLEDERRSNYSSG